MNSLDEYDDDIPLAFIVAKKSEKPAVEQSKGLLEAAKKNVSAHVSKSDKKVFNESAVRVDSVSNGKGEKKESKGSKKDKHAEDWREIEKMFKNDAIASKKPKSWLAHARDNAPTLFFFGMVIFIVGCR